MAARVYTRKPVAERFWSKVDRSGGPDACWPWTAALTRSGYGRFNPTRAKRIVAHRMTWELTYGPIPISGGYHGTCICHHCDNRPCCNPSHLFLGAQADNIADMVAKGRQRGGAGERHWFNIHPELRPRGERHGLSKLTEAQVREIRTIVASGIRHGTVGTMFGIDKETVGRIWRRQAWRHVL